MEVKKVVYPGRNSVSNNISIHPESLPSDMMREIALNLSPGDLPAFCRTNKDIRNMCNETYFWQSYLGGDQDKLHNTFVEFAKHGSFNLFVFLWNNKDLKMIKERRSLVNAIEESILNEKHIEGKIWDLDPSWLNERFGVDIMDIVEKVDEDNRKKKHMLSTPIVLQILKYTLLIRKTCENKDINAFKQLYIKAMDYSSFYGSDVWSYTDDTIRFELSHSPTLDFLISAMKILEIDTSYPHNYDEIVRLSLEHGNLTLFNQIYKF